MTADTAAPAAVEATVTEALDGARCPHLAVLLRSEAELYPALASFYGLGERRAGRLVHRSLPGEAEADRGRLSACGLDVRALESDGRLSLVEFDPDEAPEDSARPWERELEQALERGLSALWYARFAIGAGNDEFGMVLPFERAWDEAFAGKQVVTLCPYIVGELDGSRALERLHGVARHHSAVLVPREAGYGLVQSA